MIHIRKGDWRGSGGRRTASLVRPEGRERTAKPRAGTRMWNLDPLLVRVSCRSWYVPAYRDDPWRLRSNSAFVVVWDRQKRCIRRHADQSGSQSHWQYSSQRYCRSSPEWSSPALPKDSMARPLALAMDWSALPDPLGTS